MRPPSGQDDGLRLFAADKQMGRTELLPFTPNVCVLRCRRVQLRGELCSALGAATGEDLAAVGGSHSLSEAVFHFSVSFLGLICSEHAVTPPVNFINSVFTAPPCHVPWRAYIGQNAANAIIYRKKRFCQVLLRF